MKISDSKSISPALVDWPWGKRDGLSAPMRYRDYLGETYASFLPECNELFTKLEIDKWNDFKKVLP